MSTERDRTSHAAAWITIVVIAVAVYVLSIGPVAGLIVNGTIPQYANKQFGIFYAPLVVLVQVTGADPLLQAYCRWWIEVLKKP